GNRRIFIECPNYHNFVIDCQVYDLQKIQKSDNMWTLLEFRDEFSRFYEHECSPDIRVSLDSRLDILRERGNQAREPICKHLEDGIFELRAKTARVLYYYEPERQIIFVVAIIKKTDRVPRGTIVLAKQRREMLRAEREKASGLYKTH
ncbi:MAG: type II toxin-antitoxin system RelE/ParE family toxin, partial [Betaproteobacteria bacterium]